jgi:hypothetical protein
LADPKRVDIPSARHRIGRAATQDPAAYRCGVVRSDWHGGDARNAVVQVFTTGTMVQVFRMARRAQPGNLELVEPLEAAGIRKEAGNDDGQ